MLLMVASAVVIDSFGIGDSSNQQAIDEAVVQYGFLQIITVCLLGPVVEEVFYRGILFEMLKGEGNRMIGNIIAQLVSIFEGEVYSFQKATHETYKYESTPYGSESFRTTKKMLMIVQGNNKYSSYYDYNENKNYTDPSYKKYINEYKLIDEIEEYMGMKIK